MKNECVHMKLVDRDVNQCKGYFFGFMRVSKFRVYVPQHVKSLKVAGLYVQGSLAEEPGHLKIKGVDAFLRLYQG